jgi:N-acetylglucosamine-6-phosphate deacetylase
LEPGKKADIAVFDKDYNTVMTLVNGEIVYRKDTAIKSMVV